MDKLVESEWLKRKHLPHMGCPAVVGCVCVRVSICTCVCVPVNHSYAHLRLQKV